MKVKRHLYKEMPFYDKIALKIIGILSLRFLAINNSGKFQNWMMREGLRILDKMVSGYEFLKQLKEQNVQQEQRYGKLKDYLALKARGRGIPISGKFELTPLCNFSCKMCYVHLNAEQLKGQPVLSTETWKDLMHQAWEAGMQFVTLTGGECLAYPGFEELFLYLHSLGCEVAVLTNGFLMDEKRIQFFREHQPSMIQVTLYGWNDDTYERVTGQRAFTTVANNIRQAIAADLPVYITITPNKYLGEDLLETIRVAKDLCNSVVINDDFLIPREETGRSGQQDDADLDLYIRAHKYKAKLEGREIAEIQDTDLPPFGSPCKECSECGLKCGGGRSSFAISWNGIMKPCINFEAICGYPLQEGFPAAWTKVNREANNWPRVPECEGCAYFEVCNVCAVNMLRFAPPGKQPIGLCERTRAFVRNGIARIPECD